MLWFTYLKRSQLSALIRKISCLRTEEKPIISPSFIIDLTPFSFDRKRIASLFEPPLGIGRNDSSDGFTECHVQSLVGVGSDFAQPRFELRPAQLDPIEIRREGGRYSRRAPAASMNSSTPATLNADRLSITITCPSCR